MGYILPSDYCVKIRTDATSFQIPLDLLAVSTADVTKQQLDHLTDSAYPARIAVGFEGSDEDTGSACAAMFALILGDALESQNVFRGLTLISADNAETIKAGMK